ncbi:MAG: hypothetical protein AB7D57_01815 [Desulfovibrionaceae bacterium]
MAELRRELDELRELLRGRIPGAAPRPAPGDGGRHRPLLGLFRLMPGLTDADWSDLTARLDAAAWLPLSMEAGDYPVLARLQADLQALDADPLPLPASPERFRRVLDLELERSRLDKTPLSLALLQLPEGQDPDRAAAFLAARLRRHHLAARLDDGRLGLLMPGIGQGRSGGFLEELLAALRGLNGGAPRPCCGLASYRGTPELTVPEMIALADTALGKAQAAGPGRLERTLAPLPMPQLRRTLVHANEKRFLFTGTSEDDA